MLGRLSKWMGIIIISFFFQRVSNKMSSRQQIVAERGQRRNVTWKGRRSWRGGFRVTCQRESTLREDQEKPALLSCEGKKTNQRRERRRCLTIRGDFVGRVEPAVPARRRADVHVEMDVVSQPVAALLVPHEYRLLPLLRPFTSVTERRGGVEKKGKQHSTRKSDEKGGGIHHGVRNRFQRFVSPRDGVR